ncbi:hypothetical protein H8356DRAFT_999629 [Neocallimastix lanati (nom. inval.)]|jgi:hypothetical protein|nr:hypothetical protein H8356DRAFT_999629 [Neocallimastix sp. JGI-2020a]
MNKSTFLENEISEKYKVYWSTVADAERWAADLYSNEQSDQSNIKSLLDGVISNTEMKVKDGHIMASMLWSALKMFTSFNYDALKICSKALDKYADNSYKLAEFLLLAQSIGNSIDDLKFDSKKVNTSLITDAIGLLRTERNGHSTDAGRLLQILERSLENANIGYLLK